MNDRDLDRFLRTYSEQEPRAGFEMRVLNGVRSDRRHPVLPWILIPVLGCLAVTIAVWKSQTLPPPSPRVVATVAYVPPSPVIEHSVPMRRVRHTIRHHPTPAPRMTPEERALVQFAVRDPDRLRKSLEDLKEHASEPNEIVALKIEPLNTNP